MPEYNPVPPFLEGVSADVLDPSNKQPSTNNYLKPNSFKFILDRVPNITYFTQSASIPSLSLTSLDIPNPTGTRSIFTGWKSDFGQFSVTYIIDENMTNWMEIYDWYQQCTNLNDQSTIVDLADRTSDGTLIVLTSAYAKNVNIRFRGLLPVSLGEVEFSSTLSSAAVITATVGFEYSGYTVELER